MKILRLNALYSLLLAFFVGNLYYGCRCDPGPIRSSAENQKFMALYQALKEAGLADDLGWSDQEVIRKWPGVTVDARGFVTAVSMDLTAKDGTTSSAPAAVKLPKELFTMGWLTRLEIRGIELDGYIPAEIAQASSLKTLILNGCFVSHRITLPATLGALTLLDTLDLQNNPMISGDLPASLGNLAQLKYLNLNGDQGLAGSIPAEWGKMASLTYVGLRGAQLSGTLPAEWCANTSLRVEQSAEKVVSRLSCAGDSETPQ